MRITLEKIGKKYHKEWIFRNLNHTFESNSSTAITGSNGSGKSTLIKILSTFMDASIGRVSYSQNPPTETLSFASPYLELIEELTLQEHLAFHFQFKKATTSFEEMMQSAGLMNARNKYINEFSSGMKQRLRLILAFFTDSTWTLLDEPCSNLDDQGIKWYLSELEKIMNSRTIIIASNQRYEYDMCQQELSVEKYIRHEKA